LGGREREEEEEEDVWFPEKRKKSILKETKISNRDSPRS